MTAGTAVMSDLFREIAWAYMKKNRPGNSSPRSQIAPPRWLEWAREIQAISQTGAHFSENDYQQERYRRLTEIAAEIIADHSDQDY
jgi:hypothetical protein